MDVGGAVALAAVVIGGWASGRIKNSLEGISWGERAAWTATTLVGGSLLGIWGLGTAGEIGILNEWWQGATWIPSVLTGIAFGAGAWMSLRLWAMPRKYGRWNAERYARGVFAAIESGDERRITNATIRVTEDMQRIVAWAKDGHERARHEEGRRKLGDAYRAGWGRNEGGRGERKAEGYAEALIGLMGDRRWAEVVVREGGKMARTAVEEIAAQNAWKLPLEEMLHNVTMEAVRQQGSFLDHETWGRGGSREVQRQQPVMQMLYGNGRVVVAGAGNWIKPEWREGEDWGSEEKRRWMEVAEKTTETMLGPNGCWDRFLALRIKDGLEAASQRWSENSGSDGNKSQRREVLDRLTRLCRIVQKGIDREKEVQGTKEGEESGWMFNEYGEVMADEAKDILYHAACIRDDKEAGARWTKYTIWRGTAGARGFGLSGPDEEGIGVRDTISRKVCEELWKDVDEYLSRGWSRRSARVVNMILQASPEDVAVGINSRHSAELARATREAVRNRYARLWAEYRKEAEAMLSKNVTLTGNRLCVQTMQGLRDRQVREVIDLRPALCNHTKADTDGRGIASASKR